MGNDSGKYQPKEGIKFDVFTFPWGSAVRRIDESDNSYLWVTAIIRGINGCTVEIDLEDIDVNMVADCREGGIAFLDAATIQKEEEARLQ